MPQTPSPAATPISRDDFPALFAARAADGHKGTYGTLAVVGGAAGMTGAALLAARAGLRLGAGKVLVGLVQEPSPLPCDPQQPELMVRSARDLLDAGLPVSAWTVGCGIGMGAEAVSALSAVFAARGDAPMVLDADALNLLARGALTPAWGDGPIVLTPHPAEAARLLNYTTTEVQNGRPDAARALARHYQAWVVLKGAGTLVCAPDGQRCLINTSGNPGLATAGTGDVLAGMLGALLAQGLPPATAVQAAVWLHGAAADALVRAGIGPIGLTAGELADAARAIRNGR